MRLLVLLIVPYLLNLATSQQNLRSSQAQQPAPKVEQAESAGDPLKEEEFRRLSDALREVGTAQLDYERADAILRAAKSDFNRIKAEIMAEHKLAPSTHSLTPDGRRIVANPQPVRPPQ